MAQILDLRANADAVVRQDYPNNKYGNEAYFNVGEWSDGDICETFLNFDLSGLPEYARITSATLSLFQYDDALDWQSVITNIGVTMTGAAWSEANITWNTKPDDLSGSPVSNTNVQRVTDGINGTNEYQWNVLYHIQKVADGTATWNGFRVRYSGTAASTMKFFRSREYGTESQRPRLYVLWEYPYGKAKSGGAWKTIQRAQAKVGGVWVDVETIKARSGGSWAVIK